jgi:hypothetical protein
LADPPIQVIDGGAEVLAKGDFIASESEFNSDRIRHFARHQTERSGQRIADAQPTHQDVDTVGQQLAKARDTLLPHALEEEGDENDRKEHGNAERKRAVSEGEPEPTERSTINASAQGTRAFDRCAGRSARATCFRVEAADCGMRQDRALRAAC